MLPATASAERAVALVLVLLAPVLHVLLMVLQTARAPEGLVTVLQVKVAVATLVPVIEAMTKPKPPMSAKLGKLIKPAAAGGGQRCKSGGSAADPSAANPRGALRNTCPKAAGPRAISPTRCGHTPETNINLERPAPVESSALGDEGTPGQGGVLL